MAAKTLTHDQASALLDILSHAETYAEIRDFREPGTLEQYGPPFNATAGAPSTSPALQTLVSRFLLELPGLKDLSAEFWRVQCRTIIDDFQKADLSESYDKGILGSRKTLATAISALIEYPVRGTYGGFEKVTEVDREYDLAQAEDLSRAFRDFVNEAIYGDILEELVEKAAQTDQLSDQEPLIQALHEFVLVNLASFMHYTLILSPKGQYLLKLVDGANKLVPYMMIKQTLKIGNVATMMNAMVRIVLAKMSVTSVTNWMGLTQSSDDGMNLMQHIITTVLNWDNKEFESRCANIERERAAVGKEQLHALKSYVSKSRADHKRIRQQSEEGSKSIVTAILEDAKVQSLLTHQHHAQALEYLSLHLSIHDRKSIIKVLCHSQPDHLTQSVRELVSAYEPVIRNVHKAVDLSDTVGDFESFLRDTIKLSKIQTGKDGKSVILPTVGDFVQLLKKHQYSAHKFIHQCCKNGKEVTGWYLEWAKKAAAWFRRGPSHLSNDKTDKAQNKQEEESNKSKDTSLQSLGAGNLTAALVEHFSSLPEEKRSMLLPILDAQASYIASQHAASTNRLTSVLHSPPSTNPAIARIFQSHLSYASGISLSLPGSRSNSRTASPDRSSMGQSHHLPQAHLLHHQHNKKSIPRSGDDSSLSSSSIPKVEAAPGPGSFLARWQDLLDGTKITPLVGNEGGTNANNKNNSSSSGGGGDSGGRGAGEKPEPNKGVRKAKSLDVVVNDRRKQNSATSDEGNPGKETDEDDDDDEKPEGTEPAAIIIQPTEDILQPQPSTETEKQKQSSPKKKKKGNDTTDSARSRAHHQHQNQNSAPPAKPDVEPVLNAMAKSFRDLLAQRGCNW